MNIKPQSGMVSCVCLKYYNMDPFPSPNDVSLLYPLIFLISLCLLVNCSMKSQNLDGEITVWIANNPTTWEISSLVYIIYNQVIPWYTHFFFTTLTFVNPFPSHAKQFITCPINMPMVTPIITPIILPLFRRPPKMPIPVQNFRQTNTRGSIAGCKPTKMELYTEETWAFIGYHADIMRCIIIYYIRTELNIHIYIYIYYNVRILILHDTMNHSGGKVPSNHQCVIRASVQTFEDRFLYVHHALQRGCKECSTFGQPVFDRDSKCTICVRDPRHAYSGTFGCPMECCPIRASGCAV